MLENAILGKNIPEHDIIQNTQITTNKCIWSQVTVELSTILFYEW